MIKNIIVKHLYILNRITTNKVSYLNNCLYAPANNQNKSFYIKSIRIKAFNKPYNKTFISYNHFKGSKKAFNYKSYKSIKNGIFWLKGALECFKKGINKIVRLKIYKWGLVEMMLLISTNKINDVMMDFNKIILKMILISSYGWRDIKVEFIPDKFTKD